jgi:hypothetical protein
MAHGDEIIRLAQEFGDFKTEVTKKLDKIDAKLDAVAPTISAQEQRLKNIDGENGALAKLEMAIVEETQAREKYGWGIVGLGLTAFLSMVGWLINLLSPKN